MWNGRADCGWWLWSQCVNVIASTGLLTVTIFYSHRQDKKIFKKRKIVKRKYKKRRKSKNKNGLIPWHFTFSIFAGWFWHRQENTINSLIVDFFPPLLDFPSFSFLFYIFKFFFHFLILWLFFFRLILLFILSVFFLTLSLLLI